MQIMLVAVLSFIAVICMGSSVILLLNQKRMVLQSRLQGVQVQNGSANRSDFRNEVILTPLSWLGGALSSKGPSHQLMTQLAQAGFRRKSASSIFFGTKFFLMFIGFAAGLAWASYNEFPGQKMAFYAIGGGALLSFLPNYYVAHRRSRRRLDVSHHLPDAVDLLEVCVTSGMGLDAAWNSVSEEIRQVSPTLADEMALTNLEIGLGVPRTQAMRHMADRTGVDELASLVAVLIQSERFGSSIADVLKNFAVTMRELRSQRAEEDAEKIATKLIFPMVLLVFPAIIIVGVGPAALSIYDAIILGL